MKLYTINRWHGCYKCQRNRKALTADRTTTAGQAYDRTMKRTKLLTDLGYRVEQLWECELRRQLRENKEMADFFENTKIVGPLDARRGFFGGRVETTKLKHICKEGEKLMYLDVVR